MTPVVVESPFGRTPDGAVADQSRVAYHKVYLQACLADCFRLGEAPFASHGLYPGALDDHNPADRDLGMRAGFVWGRMAAKRVVYTDLGITEGMRLAIEESIARGQPVEYRALPEWKL